MRKKLAVVASLVAALTLVMVIVAPGAAARGRTRSALCSGYMWCEGMQGEGIVVTNSPRGFAFVNIDAWAGENLSNQTFEGHGSVTFAGFPFGRFTSTAIWPDNNVLDCVTTGCEYELDGNGSLNGRNVCFFVIYVPDTGTMFFNAWDCQTDAYVGSFVGQFRGSMNIHAPWES